MRVAVTYENGQVYGHFGHTEKFEIYDIEQGKIVDKKIVDTNGSGPRLHLREYWQTLKWIF